MRKTLKEEEEEQQQQEDRGGVGGREAESEMEA